MKFESVTKTAFSMLPSGHMKVKTSLQHRFVVCLKPPNKFALVFETPDYENK